MTQKRNGKRALLGDLSNGIFGLTNKPHLETAPYSDARGPSLVVAERRGFGTQKTGHLGFVSLLKGFLWVGRYPPPPAVRSVSILKRLQVASPSVSSQALCSDHFPGKPSPLVSGMHFGGQVHSHKAAWLVHLSYLRPRAVNITPHGS